MMKAQKMLTRKIERRKPGLLQWAVSEVNEVKVVNSRRHPLTGGEGS